jgi:hypothetical protein
MGGDEEVQMAEEPASERFTDEEAAFLRHARFGSLFPPVNPEDLVELVETDSSSGVPWQPFDPREWGDTGRH